MAQSQARLIREEETPPSRHGKHRLDTLDAARVAKHLVMFEPTEQDIERMVEEARKSIPGLTAAEEAIRVQRFNPICILALARKSRFAPQHPDGEGFVALELWLRARPDERPAGIYMWGVYAPGPRAAGIALFMEKMAPAQYAGVNLYSRHNTEVGRRYNEVLGLTKGVSIGSIAALNIWLF